MSDEPNVSVSSGGFNVPDIFTPPYELSKDKAKVNKSPVLYLMRRRNTDFPRVGSSLDTTHNKINWFPVGSGGKRKIEKVDPGEIYPNHHSHSRLGSIEWIKFKNYVKENANWIKQVELVID